MTAPDLIVSYIERKGWRTAPAPGGWHVSRDGAAFFLSFTASWACLQAPLAAPAGAADSRRADAPRAGLYRALLQHNEAMFMAKCALDAKGTPLLLVEIPVAGSLRLVDHALEALTRYKAVGAALLTDPESAAAPSAADRAAKDRYFDEPPGIPHEVMAYYIRAVESQGWGARSKPKGITWLLGYKGQRMFEAYLTVTRSWTYFHIPALLKLPAGAERDPAARQAFFSYLLNVNDALYMAKLGIDEQDQVILMLELPTQELEFDFFRTITRLLGTYLDLYAREIQIMSNLPADRKLMEMLV